MPGFKVKVPNTNRLLETLGITRENSPMLRGAADVLLPQDPVEASMDFVSPLAAVGGRTAGMGKRIVEGFAPQVRENFDRFFKGSKVVDEAGDPQVVFHGTAEDFDIFQHGIKRSTRGSDSGKEMFSLTPKPDAAHLYAGVNGQGENIVPSFVSMKKPKVIENFEDFASADPLSLKQEGFDGIIRKDDEGNIVEFAVFNSNQIKSATGNRGTFSSDPSIIKAVAPVAGFKVFKDREE